MRYDLNSNATVCSFSFLKNSQGRVKHSSLQGDTAKARQKYQDFLTLWKEADSEIPILKKAKLESAKLQ
jgi:hypothetical protein